MTPLTVTRPATSGAAAEPERVTPRIDSTARCHCGTDMIFDEVYGWLHATTSQPTPRALAVHVPGPAPAAGLPRSS